VLDALNLSKVDAAGCKALPGALALASPDQRIAPLLCRRCKKHRPASEFVDRRTPALAGLCRACLSPSEEQVATRERETAMAAGLPAVAEALRAWRPTSPI